MEVRNGWCRLANGHWASADYLRPDSAATVLPRAAVVAGQVLPSFASLWQNYPRDALDAVKRMIGGEVDSPDIKNTCTIRLSRALNYSGHPVPARYPGLWVASARTECGMHSRSRHALPCRGSLRSAGISIGPLKRRRGNSS